MMPPSRHMMNYSVNPSYHNTKTNEQTENQRTSFCLLATKGSITIEAAFAIPLFFLAVLALFYMMEVMSIRTSVRNGMQYAAKRAAEDCYLTQMVSPSALEADIVRAIGSERLERSIVVNGSSGSDLSGEASDTCICSKVGLHERNYADERMEWLSVGILG